MSLRIRGRPNSINVRKVVWTARELELPFERIDAGGAFGGNRTPEYLRMKGVERDRPLPGGNARRRGAVAPRPAAAGRRRPPVRPAAAARRAAQRAALVPAADDAAGGRRRADAADHLKRRRRRAPAGPPHAAMHAAASSVPGRESRERLGLLLGLAGVLAFSLTLPMTRLAVAELDAWFVGFGRMAIAGLVSAAWLALARAPRPGRDELPWLAGCVVGVVLAALWLGERHRARFWTCAAVGSTIVIAFALRHGGAVGHGHLWMLAAVLIGAVGYVAGGRLSRTMGGVNTILWSLVLALPLTLPVAAWLAATTPMQASAAAWGGLAYVTLISQIAGFFAWYNGLALGGIARIGQVQLLQAFFTIAAAAWLFGEQVEPLTWLAAAAVVATIAIGRTDRAPK